MMTQHSLSDICVAVRPPLLPAVDHPRDSRPGGLRGLQSGILVLGRLEEGAHRPRER